MVDPQRFDHRYGYPVPVPRRRPLGAPFVLAALAVLAWCGLCFFVCAFGFFASDGCPSDDGLACERPIDRAVYLGLGGCVLAAGVAVVAVVLALKWTRRRSVIPLFLLASLLAPMAVWLSERLITAALP